MGGGLDALSACGGFSGMGLDAYGLASMPGMAQMTQMAPGVAMAQPQVPGRGSVDLWNFRRNYGF